jgi:N6-adenosine-specific RNA methylase IME4
MQKQPPRVAMPAPVDLAPRIGLSVPGELSRTGWTLPEAMSLDEWLAAGSVLVTLEGRIAWGLGDWWAYGEHRYGERAALAAEGAFGEITFGQLKQYGWVSRSVERSVRTDLPWSHHERVAHLAPAEQAQWLARAEQEGWSVKDLRIELSKAQRELRHDSIRAKAGGDPNHLGPFPLLYVDPPWEFITRSDSELGKTRCADRHYETMTDDEIAALTIGGKHLSEIAHDDAAVFLWCTSSNIERALVIMRAWGFTYKSQVVWVKPDIGTGYIFREQHEVLLYGTRGDMPAPMVTPPSVIFAPRGKEHSAKPPEARGMIEAMFPFFDETTRVELFARGHVPNWTVHGYEALPREEAA